VDVEQHDSSNMTNVLTQMDTANCFVL